MDGESFIRHARDRKPACVLLDLCMPGPSGHEILKELGANSYGAPILILSGQHDVPNVVQAMRHGAFDYIEKRLDAQVIVDRVVEAIDMWRRQNDETSACSLPSLPSYRQLTPREREVLAQIAAAASNKEIAKKIGNKPANGRNPSLPHHAEDRREKLCRSDAYSHEQRARRARVKVAHAKGLFIQSRNWQDILGNYTYAILAIRAFRLKQGGAVMK